MTLRLLFLHAFPLNSRMWSGQMSIAPGRTETPTMYPLGETLTDWASAILNSVGDEPFLVVGCSMGGSCALEMARLAPERIAALALVAAKAGHRRDPEMRDRYIASLETSGVMGLWPEVLADFIGEQADRNVIAKIKSIMSEQTPEDLIRAVRVFHGRADLSEVVANWNKPLLVMYGDRDQIVTEQKAAALAESAPQAQLSVMHGCGHYMNTEQPDRFNQIIGDFVRVVENSS